VRKKPLLLLLVVAALAACALIPGLVLKALTAAPAAPTATTVFDFGSSGWSYYRGIEQPASGWATSATDWPRGTAPLGFGVQTGALATELENDFRCAPLASYFQKSFSLARVPASGMVLTSWADDGVIVYVNGREVFRKNLPTGPVHNTTSATSAPQSHDARAALVHVTIPASVLHAGKNLLSAQVQSDSSAASNVTFDARLETTTGVAHPGASAAPSAAPTASPSDAGPSAESNAGGAREPAGYLSGWGAPSWQDEFTHTNAATGQPEIDSCKWNVRDRSDLGLLFDAAVTSKDEVSVDASGIAHLRADWLETPVERPADQSGPPELWHKTAYLDQRILNDGDVSYGQRYGRWEIRAKVPTGPKTLGSLAAFWLRNSELGEIDVMEAWGYNETAAPGGQRIDTATTTVHTLSSGDGDEKYIWHLADYGAATPVWDDFHTYAFELTPSYAAIYFDNAILAKVTPLTHPNLWNENYFASPLHVRLNLHVGPSAEYWGLPDPDHKDWTQPLDFQVDYVRIWNYEKK
jgi:hypothetical protein